MTRAIAEADALRARTWYAQERARLVLSRASSPPLALAHIGIELKLRPSSAVISEWIEALASVHSL